MSMDPPGIVEAHGPPVGIRRRGRQLGSHDAASPATFTTCAMWVGFDAITK